MKKPTIPTLEAAQRSARREVILAALRATNGSRRDAAVLLDVPERTLHGIIQRDELGEVLAAEGERLGWPSRTARAHEEYMRRHGG